MNTASGSGPLPLMPGAAVGKPSPALHQQLGILAWAQMHLIAILGGGLLEALDGLRFGLGAQESGEEGGGLGGFAPGLRESPGSAGGVAVVMEVEVALRNTRKAGE